MTSTLKVDKLQNSLGGSDVKVGSLKHPDASGNNITLVSDGNVSITNTLSAGTIGNSVTMPSGSYELVTSSLDTNTATTQSEVDIHNCFTATYESYFIDLQFVAVQNGESFYVYLSTGGSSYVTAGNYHNSTVIQTYTGNNTFSYENGGQALAYWDWGYSSWGISHSSDAYERPFKVRMFVDFPYDNTKDTYGQATLLMPHSSDTGHMLYDIAGGNFNNNVSVTGIRFKMSGGNIVTHNIKVYGIRS